MFSYEVEKTIFKGSCTPPPSKSHTLRALLFAMLANGTSTINNCLSSPDTTNMINACRALGAYIEKQENNTLRVYGCNNKIMPHKKKIWVGNSGIAFRFLTAICATLSSPITITGDASICSNRPIKPLLDALSLLGAKTIQKSLLNAPITVEGPLYAGKTKIFADDSQHLSALLIVSALLIDGKTEIFVPLLKEKPWIEMTLFWFDKLGIKYQNDNFEKFTIFGKQEIKGFDFTVPSDFSSLSFPLVGALITQSDLVINNVDMKDVQGDKKIISLLQSMGANITILKEEKKLKIGKSIFPFASCDVNGDELIDALPILSVFGCFTSGNMRIFNAANAKNKECNRLSCIVTELKKMNGNICEHNDGISVKTSTLYGTRIHSHKDHRLALALCIAAMTCKETSIIEDIACVKKSYPHFVRDMRKIGAKISQVKNVL